MNIDTTPREWPRHGGELTAAAERYGIPIAEWVDLSTGINPQPWPVPPLSPQLYTRLPESAALDGLLRAARAAYQIPDSVAVAALPGTELAIHLAPLLMPAGRTAIFGPTYESHSQAWKDSGRNVTAASTELPSDVTNAVIANPNNPDGRTLSRAALEEMATTLADRGGLLLVDEAYADVDPTASICPALDRVPALVLRSLGKFYGLPGLRLGFIAGHAWTVDRIASLLGDWPVSTAAIEIGTAALRDSTWQEATRKRLAEDSLRLREILTRRGLKIVGGTSLFALAEHDDALSIHRALAEHAILTRVFRCAPNWIRFGLPPPDAFGRLDSALR